MSKGQLNVRHQGNPPLAYIELLDLLIFLSSSSGSGMEWLFLDLMSWIAFHIECGPWWGEMSEDAIVDAPVPMATSRARRIDPVLKGQLAKTGNEGTLVRSGGKAVALLHRIRKWKINRMGRTMGNDSVTFRQGQYAKAGRAVFDPTRCNIICLSLDASRVSGKDTLYVAMFAPQLGKAMWCPPQVGLGAQT